MYCWTELRAIENSAVAAVAHDCYMVPELEDIFIWLFATPMTAIPPQDGRGRGMDARHLGQTTSGGYCQGLRWVNCLIWLCRDPPGHRNPSTEVECRHEAAVAGCGHKQSML
jgi:hypothetical protein